MLTLLAQQAQPAAGGEAPPFFANPLFLMLLMGLFFVVVLLPAQRRQAREQAAMLANLKIGSKVVTSGGLVGTVVKMKEGEDEITIRSEDTKLRILRSTVIRVAGEETTEAKT